VTRHGGGRQSVPTSLHEGTSVADTALRSTKQRKLAGHLAMYKRLALTGSNKSMLLYGASYWTKFYITL
jgi:hypothetical protein